MNAGNSGASASLTGEFVARLTCSTICFRQLPLADALAAAKAAGLSAVDIGGLPGYCDHFNPDGTKDDLAKWVRLIGESGLRVHTLNVTAGDFNDPVADGAVIVRRIRHSLRAAHAVGAHGVTFSAGRKIDRATVDFSSQVACVAEGYRSCGAEAAALGLVMSFEAPHRGGLIHDAREARQLVEQCNHPAIRLIFDVGHHRRAGWALADAWNETGRFVDHVHLRDQTGGKGRYPLGAGETDFRAFLRLTEDSGYRGCFGLEFPDAAPEPAAVIEYLRRSRDYLSALHP